MITNLGTSSHEEERNKDDGDAHDYMGGNPRSFSFLSSTNGRILLDSKGEEICYSSHVHHMYFETLE